MNILHFEDSPNDAFLIGSLLRDAWPDCTIRHVVNDEEFRRELDVGGFDVILSDFSLPGYDGLQALDLARTREPFKPYIFMSGTIGEERAIEALRRGASDYVIKDRPNRLVPAIRRALEHYRASQETKRAEGRIRELADLIDKARDAIIVADLADRVQFWNQGAERITGRSAEAMYGKTLEDVFGQGIAGQVGLIRKAILATGVWTGEVKFERSAGEMLILEVRSTLILDDSGKPKSRLSIISDITERKQLEEKFLRVQRMESIGLLAAGIAHDLNNVLAPILMAAPLLRERSTSPADQRLLGTLERSAERGAGLVRQILAFAKGAGGNERSILQSKHLLRDIVGVMTATFPKNILFEDNLSSTLWPIFAHPTQIHQVFLNLCVNARDAMPRGGTLKLTAENRVLDDKEAGAIPQARPGRFVVIEVSDTGTGIPQEVLAKMWEPFFTTKAEGKGTGLGLSTVRTIVTNHLGFVDVETSPGKGTTFKVFIPAEEGSLATQDHEAESEAPRGQGELILVVDDEPSIRNIVSDTLIGHGYRVISASDGVEGVTAFAPHATQINLAITDVSMPNLGGAAFSQVIRRLNPGVRVIAMTGQFGSGADGPGGFADAQITKPCKPALLLALAHDLLHGKPDGALAGK